MDVLGRGLTDKITYATNTYFTWIYCLLTLQLMHIWGTNDCTRLLGRSFLCTGHANFSFLCKNFNSGPFMDPSKKREWSHRDCTNRVVGIRIAQKVLFFPHQKVHTRKRSCKMDREVFSKPTYEYWTRKFPQTFQNGILQYHTKHQFDHRY